MTPAQVAQHVERHVGASALTSAGALIIVLAICGALLALAQVLR